MGVSEQIQDELRRGRTPEEILELLKSKGLSEANARKFLERAQAAVADPPAVAPTAARAPQPSRPTAVPRAAMEYDDDVGDGRWAMARGVFLFLLGTLGTALTYALAKPGGKFVLLYGLILWGLGEAVVGLDRWRSVRESHPFPTGLVAGAAVFPVLILAGVYLKAERQKADGRARVTEALREEQRKRGIESDGTDPSLDPVSAYLVVLKQSPESRQKREAAWRLGEMRERARDAVPALLAALRDASGEVRRGAAEALMKIDGNNPQVVASVKTLFDDTSNQVRPAVLRDFAQKADPDAQKVLLSTLEDTRISARQEACTVLGGLHDNPAFAAPAIIGRLKIDPDWQVRIACARAAGNLGRATPEVITALEDVIASDYHPHVKQAAQESLARLAPAGK